MPQTPKSPQPPDPKNRSPSPKASAAAGGRLPAEPPELQELRKASAGLEYPSESDTPFDAFWWPAAGTGAAPGQTAREQVAAHAKPGAKVEEVPVDRFFGDLEGADDAERFKQLRQVLDVAAVGAGRVPGRAAARPRWTSTSSAGRSRGSGWGCTPFRSRREGRAVRRNALRRRPVRAEGGPAGSSGRA